MLGDLMAAYQAAKSGVELVRNALGARVDHDVDAALIGVNDHLLRLQTLALSLQGEVSGLTQSMDEATKREAALKSEIAQLLAFDADKPQYALCQVGPGAFAYRKASAGETTGDAPHADPWLCPQCFDQCRKSILQYAGHEARDRVFKCLACGSVIRVKGADAEVWVAAPSRRSRRLL